MNSEKLELLKRKLKAMDNEEVQDTLQTGALLLLACKAQLEGMKGRENPGLSDIVELLEIGDKIQAVKFGMDLAREELKERGLKERGVEEDKSTFGPFSMN